MAEPGFDLRGGGVDFVKGGIFGPYFNKHLVSNESQAKRAKKREEKAFDA